MFKLVIKPNVVRKIHNKVFIRHKLKSHVHIVKNKLEQNKKDNN